MRNRIHTVNKYNERHKAHCLCIIKVSFILYSNISIPRKGNILMLDAVYNLETFFKKQVEKERGERGEIMHWYIFSVGYTILTQQKLRLLFTNEQHSHFFLWRVSLLIWTEHLCFLPLVNAGIFNGHAVPFLLNREHFSVSSPALIALGTCSLPARWAGLCALPTSGRESAETEPYKSSTVSLLWCNAIC